MLILDNVESLIDGDGRGQLRPGYEDYAQLLHRLAHSQHNSYPAADQPRTATGPGAAGKRDRTRLRVTAPGRVSTRMPARRSWLLGDVAGQHGARRALVERYSGHPLALKLVAQTVQDLFAGAYQRCSWRDETPIFDDIRTVLDQQYARLSELEREILNWLAIEREPITIPALRENLVHHGAARDFVAGAARAATPLAAGAGGRRLQLAERGDRVSHRAADYGSLRRAAARGPGESAARTTRDAAHVPGLPAALNRFALVKAQAKDYVRESQKRMILQPVVDRLLDGLGTSRTGGARRRRSWPDCATQAPRAPGYAGGNLLNLLLHAGIDVAGYDFSRLTVWQAELQGRVGAGIHFGAADLTGSTFTLTMSPWAAIVDAAGHLMLVGSDAGALCVWRISHRQLELAVRTPAAVAERLVVSRDGQLVAAACLDDTVRVWSVTTGALLHTLEGYTESVQSVTFSHDTQLLATSSSDDTICLWDVTSGQRRTVLRHPLLRRSRLAFRPARTGDRHTAAAQLASGGDEQTICVWDLEHGHVVDELRGHTREIECLAFSADGTLLASGSHDGVILVWDVQSSGHGSLRSTLRGHSHIVRTLVFHPSRPLLASGSADGTVCLWDLGTDQTRQLVAGRSSGVIASRLRSRRPAPGQRRCGAGRAAVGGRDRTVAPIAHRLLRCGGGGAHSSGWTRAGQCEWRRADPPVGQPRWPACGQLTWACRTAVCLRI